MRKPCEGHTVSVVDKCLYILFGKHEDDNANAVCPPMQVLDTENMLLSTPLVRGHGADERSDGIFPDDREGHTASVFGRRILIFGGTWTDEDDTTIYMNDLFVLDVGAITDGTLSWNKPGVSGSPPIEREGHTAAAVGSRMFVFGGTWVDDDDNSIYLNDLWILNTETMVWSQGMCTGEPPIQREGHTASVVGATMCIFGGAGLDSDDRPVNLSDLHVLDTDTMAWSHVATSGRVPQERCACLASYAFSARPLGRPRTPLNRRRIAALSLNCCRSSSPPSPPCTCSVGSRSAER